MGLLLIGGLQHEPATGNPFNQLRMGCEMSKVKNIDGGARAPAHPAHWHCGCATCVICVLSQSQIERVWLECKSINNRDFCQEFARNLLAAAVSASFENAAISDAY